MMEKSSARLPWWSWQKKTIIFLFLFFWKLCDIICIYSFSIPFCCCCFRFLKNFKLGRCIAESVQHVSIISRKEKQFNDEEIIQNETQRAGGGERYTPFQCTHTLEHNSCIKRPDSIIAGCKRLIDSNHILTLCSQFQDIRKFKKKKSNVRVGWRRCVYDKEVEDFRCVLV